MCICCLILSVFLVTFVCLLDEAGEMMRNGPGGGELVDHNSGLPPRRMVGGREEQKVLVSGLGGC